MTKVLILITSDESNRRRFIEEDGPEWENSWWQNLSRHDNFRSDLASFLCLTISDDNNGLEMDSIPSANIDFLLPYNIRPGLTYFPAKNVYDIDWNEHLSKPRVLIVVDRQVNQDKEWVTTLKDILEKVKNNSVLIAYHGPEPKNKINILNYSATEKIWENMLALRYGGFNPREKTEAIIFRCNAFDELWTYFSTKFDEPFGVYNADSLADSVLEAITGVSKSQKNYSNLKHTIIGKTSSLNLLLDALDYKDFNEELYNDKNIQSRLSKNELKELRNLLYGNNSIQTAITKYMNNENIVKEWDKVQSLLPLKDADTGVEKKYDDIKDILKGNINLDALKAIIKCNNRFSLWHDDFVAALNNLHSTVAAIDKNYKANENG